MMLWLEGLGAGIKRIFGCVSCLNWNDIESLPTTQGYIGSLFVVKLYVLVLCRRGRRMMNSVSMHTKL